MKKFLVLLGLISAGSIASLFSAHTPAHSDTNGAPAGRTGSPGDGSNCTFCHTGTATTQAGLITSNIPVTGYVPGFTYQITGTVTFAGRVKFGFEISPQSPTGTKLGNLVATNTTETQTKTAGKYITHKSAGTSASSGTKSWTCNWVAPAAGTGTVTFYGAFNCTNNLNTSSGDVVYLSTLVVSEDLSGVKDEPVAKNTLHVYPTLAENEVIVEEPESNSFAEGDVSITVYSIDGRLLKNLPVDEHTSTGKYSIDVQAFPAGTYIVCYTKGDFRATQRFIKQ